MANYQKLLTPSMYQILHENDEILDSIGSIFPKFNLVVLHRNYSFSVKFFAEAERIMKLNTIEKLLQIFSKIKTTQLITCKTKYLQGSIL